MDVLIVNIEDDLAVLNIDGKTLQDAVDYVHRLANHARMKVSYAVVEVTSIDEWGPGDVFENLQEPQDMPTAQFYELDGT